LHIVRQPAIKEPVLRCAGWNAEDIAVAFDNVLDQHLEPFGLEKRDTGDVSSSDLSSA
jgi:hypothetical protein